MELQLLGSLGNVQPPSQYLNSPTRNQIKRGMPIYARTNMGTNSVVRVRKAPHPEAELHAELRRDKAGAFLGLAGTTRRVPFGSHTANYVEITGGRFPVWATVESIAIPFAADVPPPDNASQQQRVNYLTALQSATLAGAMAGLGLLEKAKTQGANVASDQVKFQGIISRVQQREAALEQVAAQTGTLTKKGVFDSSYFEQAYSKFGPQGGLAGLAGCGCQHNGFAGLGFVPIAVGGLVIGKWAVAAIAGGTALALGAGLAAVLTPSIDSALIDYQAVTNDLKNLCAKYNIPPEDCGQAVKATEQAAKDNVQVAYQAGKTSSGFGSRVGSGIGTAVVVLALGAGVAMVAPKFLNR